VDGGPSQAVGINETVTLTGLAEGDHSVELTGVANNCTVSGTNPRTVTVPFAGTVTESFGVDCVPRVGDLEVNTVTTGLDLDPEGYTVTVDGGPSQTMGVNGTVTFTGLTEGDHSVALSGVAPNCWVLSANPTTVPVPFAVTATTTFSVSCVEIGVEIMVGAGDIGYCNASSGDEGTAAILDTIPGTVFTAGDNANPDGTADQFTNCYDPTWGRHLSRTRPTPGNRDYLVPGAGPYFAYFGSRAGTAGEGWYSYDLGNWHVVALNSELDLSDGSAQHNWLVSDLAASGAQCTMVIYHHPRFHSGNAGGQGRSEDAWEAMYAAGVELVVGGHSHIYERFAPQTPDSIADPVNGIRQFVVGTGGHTLHKIWAIAPNSEVRDNSTFGVIVFTLRDGSYDWQFVPVSGGTFADSGSGTCH
jgi:hypothetical protein